MKIRRFADFNPCSSVSKFQRRNLVPCLAGLIQEVHHYLGNGSIAMSGDYSGFLRILGDVLTQSVLIVDDEPMARTLLRLMLVRAGFNVAEAEDGYDALNKVKQNQPDIILLDVMMPGMDGFTVCETLRREQTTSMLPVIMLSAKTDLDSINKGLRVGATKYLTKPISPEDLTRHVKEVLDLNPIG